MHACLTQREREWMRALGAAEVVSFMVAMWAEPWHPESTLWFPPCMFTTCKRPAAIVRPCFIDGLAVVGVCDDDDMVWLLLVLVCPQAPGTRGAWTVWMSHAIETTPTGSSSMRGHPTSRVDSGDLEESSEAVVMTEQGVPVARDSADPGRSRTTKLVGAD